MEWFLAFLDKIPLIEKLVKYVVPKEEVKWVNLGYENGNDKIQAIKDEGYILSWSNENETAIRTEQKGYGIVKVREGRNFFIYKVKSSPSNLILLKKKG